MNVLVACEESQTVCKAFRDKGHNAYSCDVISCSGGYPEWHLQMDVRKILDQDIAPWDLMVAHPPCTYLTVTANRSYINNPRRWALRLKAMLFVHRLLNTDIPKICLENPVGVISTHVRKPDQIIQPWMFGDSYQKRTCLWLKGLPKLTPTKIVAPGEFVTFSDGVRMPKWFAEIPSNTKLRSKTFQGIADAMAAQWGEG